MPDAWLFFPGFWDGVGWGFGVAVETLVRTAVAILLTQVELGERMMTLFADFQHVRA